MPLSSPSGGTTVLAPVAWTGDRTTFNNGALINVIFRDAWWNQNTNRGVIGGGANYVGLLSDMTKNKINQTPALTSTVLLAGNVFSPFLDDNDDIYVAGTGGGLREMAMSTDSGATWVLIPNSPIQSQINRGMTVTRGRIYYTANAFSSANDLAFSDDLGATWFEHNSNLTAGGNRIGLITNTLQTHLVNMRGQSDFSFCINPLANPPTWTQVITGGNFWTRAAFNADASRFVAVSIDGAIIFSTDSMGTFTNIADAVNPLIDPGAGLMTTVSIVYSPVHEGFIILTPRDVGAFIPDSNPAAPEPIFNNGQASLNLIGTLMADAAGNFLAPNAQAQDLFFGNFNPFT